MRSFVYDLIERTVATYVEVFCGLLIVSWAASLLHAPGVVDWSIVTKAAIAAVPAALAVVKNIVGGLIGNPDSAAAVPRRVDRKGLQHAPVPADVELAFHSNVKDGGGQRLGFDPHGTPLPMTKISDDEAAALMTHGPTTPRRRVRKG